MRLFALGNRLALCASMVRPGAALADVGTDHAYLPVWLARRGVIRGAVASDVRPGPLEHAERNIARWHVADLVEPRLSDGLDGIAPEEADDIVIAGMGGLMIASIIRRAPWLKNGEKRLILQPMTRAEDLRRSLADQGFAVLREEAVREEGRYYTVMLCAYDPERSSGNGLYPYIGRLTAKTPESRACLRREAGRLRARETGLLHCGEEKKARELSLARRQIESMLLRKGRSGMSTVGEIYQYIDGFAPFSSAMDFDNPGLLVGSAGSEVHSAILSLDITPDVVREAERTKAQLIISHHPVIFHPLKNLQPGSAPYLLAQCGIAAICAHTNLDMARGGVNDCLAARLGLRNTAPIALVGPSDLRASIAGETEREYAPRDFAAFVKEALGCNGLFFADGGRKITRVGVCGGGGSEYLYDAAARGCQAFVTGEAKHHELIDAKNLGVTLIAAGHYFTENVVIRPLRERLQGAFPDVVFRETEAFSCPAEYL